MIRSSRHSFDILNAGKFSEVQILIDEYRRFCRVLIDQIWESGVAGTPFCPTQNKLGGLPKFLPSDFLNAHESWLSGRMKQACGKQAISMLQAATEKRRKQFFVLKKRQKAGVPVKFLQSKIDRTPLVKPRCHQINPELDSRFVDFKKDEGSKFEFVRIRSIGSTQAHIKIPISETKMSKKWANKGIRKICIRLADDHFDLIFDIPNAPVSGDRTIGADQGISTCLSLSNGMTTQKCIHGHDLSSIMKGMSRKKSGSKGFQRAQDHRTNYINWSLNQFRSSFKDVKEVRLEKIHQIRKGRSDTGRFRSHWTYTEIKTKLTRLGEEEGFLLCEVSNEFRSQRCSVCGWVRKANRKGKTFSCTSALCLYKQDADMNAASNLELDLFEIPRWVRLRQMNLKGFFWKNCGLFTETQERIVPETEKTDHGIEDML